ncbi:MAG: hypothetical protein HYT66_00110, partial [Candidatus Yanofskybacteria bacterium]|nr:hypothetical protein [Candidatus Yanofskybacteria bacterium]
NENAADLTGLEGRDDLYAISLAEKRDNKRNPRRQPNDPVEEWFVPLGFLVKREGQMLEPVYAVPGPSANKLEKIGGAQNITDLTPVFRAILRNARIAVAPRENGQRVRIEFEPHLQPTKRQEAVSADTEE